MSKYRYGGLEPVPDGEGSMVRPGEVREFTRLPGYGPWEPVDDGPEPPREAPPRPAPPAPPPAPAAPSSTATPPAAGNGGN
jgi:hypothetical protein